MTSWDLLRFTRRMQAIQLIIDSFAKYARLPGLAARRRSQAGNLFEQGVQPGDRLVTFEVTAGALSKRATERFSRR